MRAALVCTVGLALLGAVAIAGPALAETRVEASSTTTFQLRRELDGAWNAPLYEDLFGSLSVDLPKGRGEVRGLALLKLGTVLGRPPGGDVDLYLLRVSWLRRQKRLRLEGGRQIMRTASGLRIVDGLAFEARPVPVLRVEAAAGWIRDTERDDMVGGALLVQGGFGLSALPNANLGVMAGLRVGPDTAPRLDARINADAVLPIPLAPRPWADASFRLDSGGLRHLRGGLVFTPMHLVNFEVKARVDQVVDLDGTLARRILATMTDSPSVSVGGGARVRGPGGLAASASYHLKRFEVQQDYPGWGHGVDVRVGWLAAFFGLDFDYTFRTSYGGTFHAAGARISLTPHRAFQLVGTAQIAPYSKLAEPWKIAHWTMAEIVVRPHRVVEIRVGAEFRSGAVLAQDTRVNAVVTVHGAKRRAP